MNADAQPAEPIGPQLPDPTRFSDGIAAAAPTPPPQPVTAANLQVLYDQIYTKILSNDYTTRRLQKQIDNCEKAIRRQCHLRHVAGAGMRVNSRLLKLMAEEELRKQVGVRVLPGFKARSETNAQFLARMKRRFREIEEQERKAVLAAEQATRAAKMA